MLADTYMTSTQLILPNEINVSEEYDKFYIDLTTRTQQFVIMDNGAAEANQMSDRSLMDFVTSYMPDEFAIPDTLGESDDTIAKALAFLTRYGKVFYNTMDCTGLGLVAQGRTVNEAYKTVVSVYDQAKYDDLISTIYLPRLLLAATDNPTARIELLEMLYDRFGTHFNYHFFGASPVWPREMQEAAATKIVRSFDTSMPYYFGMRGISLRTVADNNCDGVTRPMNYFDWKMNPHSAWTNALIKRNVQTALEWSRG